MSQLSTNASPFASDDRVVAVGGRPVSPGIARFGVGVIAALLLGSFGVLIAARGEHRPADVAAPVASPAAPAAPR